MDFKIGDVVVLKSGGPEMTVSEYPIKMIEALITMREFNAGGLVTIII